MLSFSTLFYKLLPGPHDQSHAQNWGRVAAMQPEVWGAMPAPAAWIHERFRHCGPVKYYVLHVCPCKPSPSPHPPHLWRFKGV